MNDAPPLATNQFDELIRSSANRRFVPLAYYEKHMDCIRIELRDCSLSEERMDELLTVLYDNHPQDDRSPVAGLMIKGVKHFFKKHGLPLEGIVLVTEILDRIVKEMPISEEMQNNIIRPVEFMASGMELSVDMSEAA